jgi:hypothetical protein
VPNGAAVGLNADGLPVGAAGDGTSGSVLGSATELAGFRSDGMTTALAALAGVELLLVMVVPALLARRMGRNRGEQP